MRTTIDRIGKYELKAVLARTAVSTVYDGWNADIAKRVAIKLMPLQSWGDAEAGEALARFKRGAQAAGQLNHPSIVDVYDYGETDDYAYLVMEFVEGPTLKALFDENQRFNAFETCRIVGSILDALQYSHDRGVVHRDVKPANIMFSKTNQVKITDFGIARLEDSEMTQAGMVIGTPAYMSPEQFLGEKIDLRTDIYSTGVLLYQMLTGERPYEGNLATIMHKVLYGSAVLPSRASTVVTPALEAVVTRAMARSRDDRFASAREFNMALQATLVAPPCRDPTPPRPRIGPKLGFLTLAVALLAGAGGLGWYAFDHFRSPGPDKLANAPPQETKPPGQTEQALKQARINQLEQARIQLQQSRLRQQEEEEEQARLKLAQQQQEQARLQQQEQVRLLQQEQARVQQQEQARQQQQERARQQQQEQARLQQQEQARLQQQEQTRQQQEQARQQQQEQLRVRQEQEDARIRQALEQARLKAERDRAAQSQPPAPRGPQKEQLRPQQEANNLAPSRPPAPLYPVHSTSGLAGLVCESVTADTAAALGMDSPQGMIVGGVTAGFPAEKAGIRMGDVILKINGSDVRDLSSLSNIVTNGPGPQFVPVEILSHGARRVVQLAIGQGQR